ncbi:TonB-dependent receptor plug domain-containing protein [Algihabitans albus]|uniref:TonB-dependent receptor plug domain-containing protein n=1 Tax=Algihabitans albus TaxID=2164067 RepID=UPI000E5CC91E|nr:TonB-dependent receptor [Algihabitans albus]
MSQFRVPGAALRGALVAGTAMAVLNLSSAAAQESAASDNLVQGSVPQVPEVVVSASRVPLPSVAVGSAVTVITGEELENKQSRFVADVLREVPGVSVNRTGGFGGLTQVRIRGAEANHTLVLIDGMEVGDPFNGSEFDFSQLLTNDIERIEILRGAQSALYGSEAIGGVISITTKAARPGFAASLAAEGGSFATKNLRGSANAGFEDFDLRVGIEAFETAGFDLSPSGDENDFSQAISANFRSAYRPVDDLEFRVNGRLVDRELETDGQDFVTTGEAIDADTYNEIRDLSLRAEGQLDLFGGAWEQTLGGAFTRSDLDRFDGGALTSGSVGSKRKLDYQSNVTLETPNLLETVHGFTVFGEVEQERFENIQPFVPTADREERTTNYAVVGEYRLQAFERLFLSGSLRHDAFEEFEDATTYRVTGSFDVPETGSRLHASYGTGIKAPTFFELFGFDPGTFVGNPNLEPERSEGWDVGIEQQFLDGRVVADVTYFQADLFDEISSDFAGGFTTPVNLSGESERNGVETSLRIVPFDGLTLTGSYTFMNARQPDDRFEIRRPRHSASFNANWSFLDARANLNLGVDYNGEAEDLEFATATDRTRVRLDDYTLVSLAGRYRPVEGVEVFGRIENALNQDYQEVFGFETPGRAVFVGARFSFGPSGLQ